MKYKNAGKIYNVDEVNYGGMLINVNGTTITDMEVQSRMLDTDFGAAGYSVFCDGDEIFFPTFEDAYIFATTEQVNTGRL